MSIDENRLPHEQEPTTRTLAMPSDTNAYGDIFGGWIMSQVDIAGAIAAYRRANRRVVTVAVNAFQFKQPVFVGDLVSCYASVIKVGTSSLTVDVQVFAERGRDPEKCVLVTDAVLTYVAVNEEGQSVAVD